MDVCQRLIGPPERLAAVVGTGAKAPYQWRRASDNRDAGDLPSARHMRALLAFAAAQGIPLTADHLIWGADAAEIEALASDAAAARQAAQ
jgi:hypothetical protein